MASGTISTPRKIVDVRFVTGTYGSGFTVSAHTPTDITNKVGSYSVPDGYTELVWWLDINGDARVQIAGVNTYWVANVSATNSNTIVVRRVSICVKYG